MTTEVVVRGHAPLREGDCRVIAEAGANHNNSVEKAIEMSERAAEAGAWAIKFQLYRAGTLTVPESPKYWTDPFGTKSQYEAFQLSDKMPYEDWRHVADACRDLGIAFFATPFDFPAVDALEALDVPVYKLASADITHRKLIESVAATGKPLLLSTGAATLDEIDRAIEWSGLGPEKLVLLACTLTYPTPDPDANFARIETLRSRYAPYLIGTSDHTLGPEGALLTAALGGVCIEKHYTISPDAPDIPDHAMSVTPEQLKVMVDTAHRGATLRGSSEVAVRESEKPARAMARRSVVSAVPIPEGTVVTEAMIDYRRPGTGIPAYEYASVVGKTAVRDIPQDVTIDPEDLQ